MRCNANRQGAKAASRCNSNRQGAKAARSINRWTSRTYGTEGGCEGTGLLLEGCLGGLRVLAVQF